MGELNIDVLCVHSPQAKGRVERVHLTLQDRLVKELRLRNVSSVAAANAFAPEFMADFNRRFGRDSELPATPFRKAGGARQQDVADNKYLATILEGLRQTQLAEDERVLAEGRKTRREKAQLSASIEGRRAAAQ